MMLSEDRAKAVAHTQTVFLDLQKFLWWKPKVEPDIYGFIKPFTYTVRFIYLKTPNDLYLGQSQYYILN